MILFAKQSGIWHGVLGMWLYITWFHCMDKDSHLTAFPS